MPVGTAGKKLDLLIKQGADYVLPFQITDPDNATLPLDLTGYTVRSQVRKTVKSATTVASFVFLLDADPTTGRFTLSLTNTVTAAIPAGDTRDSKDSLYAWDAELVSASGFVTPIAYGDVRIHPEVTR